MFISAGNNRGMRLYFVIFRLIIYFLGLVAASGASSDILKAKRFFEFHEYQDCLKELHKSLDSGKFDLESHRLYQDVMMELDEYPSLIKEYRDKVRQFPKDSALNYLYGRLLLQNSLSIESAEKYFAISIRMNPQFPWSYQALADISTGKADFEKALAILEECVKRCPAFVPSCLEIVHCYIRLYGPLEAIKRFIKMSPEVTSDLEMKLMLTYLHMQLDHKREAESLISTMINDYKEDYRYHRVIYAAAEYAESSSLKEIFLIQLWKNYPNSPLIPSVYRKLYGIYKSNNMKKALEFIGEAIDFKTNNNNLISIAYQDLIKLKKGNINELEQIGNKIISSDFANPNILNLLGESILDKDKTDLAISLFTRAIDSCIWRNLKNTVFFGPLIIPEEKRNLILTLLNGSYFNLGRAYYKKGEFKKALDNYLQIKEADGQFGEDVIMSIANCYINLGNRGEGFRILTKLYRDTGSKKAIKMLDDVFRKEQDASISNEGSGFEEGLDSVNHIPYFNEYKNKIIVLGLHRSSCIACLKLLNELTKLENKLRSIDDVIFINLFYENEPGLKLDSAIIDRDLFIKIVLEFKLKGVPGLLIIDKNGKVRYRMSGYRDDVKYLEDLDDRISFLRSRKNNKDPVCGNMPSNNPY